MNSLLSAFNNNKQSLNQSKATVFVNEPTTCLLRYEIIIKYCFIELSHRQRQMLNLINIGAGDSGSGFTQINIPCCYYRFL